MAPAMSRLPVTVVTGFLGSGKTTLINRALRDPGLRDTAVIVNEFGDIGLDHDLIEASSDAVILLKNGCLCCSVRGDLVDTLVDLHRKRQRNEIAPFDRVLVETSGLAEPTPVLEVLLAEPGVKSCFSLAGIVAAVDAVNGPDTLDRHEQSIKQVALADRIVLTKCDLAETTDGIEARLRSLNPSAEIIDARDLDPSRLFTAFPGAWSEEALAAAGAQPDEAHAHRDHNSRVRRFSVTRDAPWSMEILRLFVDALQTNAGPSLLRVKGIINVAESPDAPAVIHGAQQLVHSLAWMRGWPSADRRTRIVFITLDADAGDIEDLIDYIERLAQRTRSVRERAAGA